jgi:LPXTG-motif cell wall-anchored protein
MLNKRQAMIGWLVWVAAKPIAKQVMKRKARGAVPGTREGSRAPNKAAIVAGLGALAGALFFWRRRKAGNGEPEPAPEA